MERQFFRLVNIEIKAGRSDIEMTVVMLEVIDILQLIAISITSELERLTNYTTDVIGLGFL